MYHRVFQRLLPVSASGASQVHDAAAAAAAAVVTMTTAAGGCSSHITALQQLSSRSITTCLACNNDSSSYNRGATAGEAGDAAAQKMSSKVEPSAAGSGSRVEESASRTGFIPGEGPTSPDIEAAGTGGAPGAAAMGDITDMVAAAFAGDDRRAAKDVADLTSSNEGTFPSSLSPPKGPPAVEQNPPEQAAAGVAGGGYAARGGDNRAI